MTGTDYRVRTGILRAELIHIMVFAFIYFVLQKMSLLSGIPSDSIMCKWDAEWYHIIKSSGYYYSKGKTNPMAFFPLFPFIWYTSGLNNLGISIANLFIFYTGFYLIGVHLKVDTKRALFYLSTPSLFFCFVPYSEAIFFLGCTFLLIGLDNENRLQIITGIIIIGLARSIGISLIGTLTFVFIIKTTYTNKHKEVRNYLVYTGTLLMTALFVFFIQFLFSGKWWVFFDVQKLWHRELRFPNLPFTTISGKNILWLDSLALLTCEIAALTCTVLLYIRIKGQKALKRPSSVLLSWAYLALAGFLATFYSGVHNTNEGTSIYSINRFVFVTPFFIVALDSLLSNAFRKVSILILIVLMLITWLITGIVDLHSPLYFISLTIYVSAYLLLSGNFNLIFYTMLFINFLLQVILFNAFINGNWVG
jgi:hypothetical protein